MATTTTWIKAENGDRICGDYRVVQKSGYSYVYNGDEAPILKKVSLKKATAFVEDKLAGQATQTQFVQQADEPEHVSAAQPAPALDYDSFVLALLEGNWTPDQIGGDEPQPPALAALLTQAGDRVDVWLAQAVEAGDLDDKNAVAQSLSTLHSGKGKDAADTPENALQLGDDMATVKLRAGNANDQVPRPVKRADKVVDVQKTANELVWKHGKNFANRGDYPDLRAAAGLTEELTDEQVSEALRQFDARLARNRNGDRLVWLPPEEEDINGQSKAHVWRTECGTYRVCRVDGPQPRFAAFAKVSANAASEREIGNDIKSLHVALEAAEKWHCDQMELPAVRSNKDRIVDEAVVLGLHKRPALPVVDTNKGSPAEGENEMKLTEKQARDLAVTLKLPGAADWALPKLSKVLNDFQPRIDGADITHLSTDERKLLRAVLDANHKGKKVQVGDAAAAGPSQPKGKKAATKAAGEKTKPGKAPGGGTDNLGSRLGSQAAKINAALTKKAKKVEDIVTETGLSAARVNSHMKWLLTGKHVTKTEAGFALVK